MTITPVMKLVAAANAEVTIWSVEEARAKLGNESVLFVDIRDIRELWREGTIPAACHAPRGMLEFWFDPSSPYAREMFQSQKTFVLFCASGWRSALAAKTLKDMGFANIAHMDGGFNAWKDAGHSIEERKQITGKSSKQAGEGP